MKHFILSLSIVVGFWCAKGHAQNAAIEKIANKLTEAQFVDLQSNTPYKYQGMLMFYSDSWFISEQGVLRAPTEQEIRTVDIDRFTAARLQDQRTTVYDDLSGLTMVLMGKDEFEQLYMGRLNPTDLQAYLAYKSSLENTHLKSSK
jgi:hypothetical protein